MTVERLAFVLMALQVADGLTTHLALKKGAAERLRHEQANAATARLVPGAASVAAIAEAARNRAGNDSNHTREGPR